MKWSDINFHGAESSDPAVELIRRKFSHFINLLKTNNHVLKIISDMESRQDGRLLVDINYIRSNLAEVRAGVGETIEHLIALGGEGYTALRDVCEVINREIDRALPGIHPIERDEYTISFDAFGRDRIGSVGVKNANLGEMKNRLRLPVPDGFAISAWAYKRFIDANDLQPRITGALDSLDLKNYSRIRRAGEEIQAMILKSQAPDDLAAAILQSYAALRKRSKLRKVALRSSALGEDTQFSFAGQYRSILNVREDQIVDAYKEVIAGKFTPRAIYYFLSHSLAEPELAMSVCCVTMIDASSSGVVYTRNPADPRDGDIMVSAVFGFGSPLVEGAITPDVFRLARGALKITSENIADKPVRLVRREEGGMIDEPMPAKLRRAPSVSEETLRTIAEYALRVESHFGCPQDIEWVVDDEGRLFLLQARPLHVLEVESAPGVVAAERAGLKPVFSGGLTVCPGAGAGVVHVADSSRDLSGMPENVVLIAPHPFPGLFTVMERVAALITETGGVASHMSTIARECGIPTITDARGIRRKVSPGDLVTVDAANAAVYPGVHKQIIRERRAGGGLLETIPIYALLKNVLAGVSPLNLRNPAAADFTPENCRTLHDIIRYAHQKSMSEMFAGAAGLDDTVTHCVELKTGIPMKVRLLFLDEESAPAADNANFVEPDEIDSTPFSSFWRGVESQGWPGRTPAPESKGLLTMITAGRRDGRAPEFSEKCFIALSRNYMNISLRMGYHFTTVESLCSPYPERNYIRLQHKGGGSTLDRRMRRIALIADILTAMGFENRSAGDFLDAALQYRNEETTAANLAVIGRLVMMVKQLDMALSNDSLRDWYAEDFKKKLGLAEPPRETEHPPEAE